MRQHGPTAAGADWSCEATQELRFEQLLRFPALRRGGTINDVGCGWGALFGHLRHRGPRSALDYLGIDISAEMIRHARRCWADQPAAKFRVASRSPRVADFSVASGTFNVKLDAAREPWEESVRDTLEAMARTSSLGLAVNFLASGPAHLAQAPQLYRTDPEPWIAYLRDTLAMRVELVAGYGLNEFTLLARH